MYTVIFTEDYSQDVLCDPASVEIFNFRSKKEAELKFSELEKEFPEEHGTFLRIELWKGVTENITEDLIKDVRVDGKPLPENAIIVSYTHNRYLGYSYDIINVQVALPGMTTSDLNHAAWSAFRDIC